MSKKWQIKSKKKRIKDRENQIKQAIRSYFSKCKVMNIEPHMGPLFAYDDLLEAFLGVMEFMPDITFIEFHQEYGIYVNSFNKNYSTNPSPTVTVSPTESYLSGTSATHVFSSSSSISAPYSSVGGWVFDPINKTLKYKS